MRYLRGCGDIAERQVGEPIVFRKTDFAATYRFLQPSEVFLRQSFVFGHDKSCGW